MGYNDIYTHDLWINKNINYMFNQEIIEYDIESAGLNLAIKFQLLPEEVCEELKSLKKEDRVVKLGLLQKNDNELKNKLKEAFVKIRKLFFEKNELDLSNVISIKKDAVFVTKECKHTTFDNVKFRPKHTFTSYILLGRLECYYNQEELVIKGMNERELQYHQDYMLTLIRRFFYKMETGSKEDCLRFITSFINRYKRKELDIEYYKEFKAGGTFRMVDRRDENVYPDFPKERIDEVDISYNFLHILCQLALIAL